MHPWVGLSDHVRLGAVARWVTPELAAEAIDGCGVRDKKPGALPAGSWCISRSPWPCSSRTPTTTWPSELLCRKICAHRPDGGDRPDADLRRTTPARRDDRVRGPLQRTTTPSQPRTPPAPARPPCRRPLPGADQAPTSSRRPPQRIRAGRVEAQVRTGGRVLEADKLSGRLRGDEPVAGWGIRLVTGPPVLFCCWCTWSAARSCYVRRRLRASVARPTPAANAPVSGSQRRAVGCVAAGVGGGLADCSRRRAIASGSRTGSSAARSR